MIIFSRIFALAVLLSAILMPSQPIDEMKVRQNQMAAVQELRIFLPEAPQFFRKVLSPGPVLIKIIDIVNRIFREPICEVRVRGNYNTGPLCNLSAQDPAAPDNIGILSWNCTDPALQSLVGALGQVPCALYEARSPLQPIGTLRGNGTITIDLDDYAVPAITFQLRNKKGEICDTAILHAFQAGRPTMGTTVVPELARSCSFTTASPLPSGNVDIAYSANLEITATNFTPTAISCSVTAGEPPTNTALSNDLPNSQCVLSGTPSSAADYTFTAQAVFTPSATCSKSYTVTIST